MINKAILLGRIGQPPKIHQGKDGNFATFSVATGDKDRTVWHSVSVFSPQLADIVEKYADKGSLVYIEGSIEYREFERDGVKKSATQIVLGKYGSTLKLLSGKKEADSTPSHAVKSGPKEEFALDDEIPF